MHTNNVRRKLYEALQCSDTRSRAAVAALPVALAVASAPAAAQWSAQQQPQTQTQRGSRYPQQVIGNYNNRLNQELFEWSGRVDKEIRIQMSGSRASVIQIGNNERGTGRARAMAAMPRGDGNVTVQVLEGRGRVDIVQQPTRATATPQIVRVRDPDSGQGTYRIAAYWQGAYNTALQWPRSPAVTATDARSGKGC